MERLDGNAIAGPLHEIFGEEMTTATATCQSCGSAAAIAEAVVYCRLPGEVVRCRHCDALLMVLTRIHGMYCVDLRGIAELRPPGA